MRENVETWSKVKGLVEHGAFKSLIYILLNELEIIEQDITGPEQMHKFWHLQGAKSILYQLRVMENTANQMILKYTQAKLKTESEAPELTDYH